jgi:hypothetical protein|tara:strand:- start:11134 stop:11337 length:204 start_codon:yes stop_codon:yes gene_type:complete
MPFLLKYLGAVMIKKLLIGWVFEAAFDLIIEYAEKLTPRTDTDIDDDAVAKFKKHRTKFIDLAKGRL